jgi:hypothetical protein
MGVVNDSGGLTSLFFVGVYFTMSYFFVAPLVATCYYQHKFMDKKTIDTYNKLAQEGVYFPFACPKGQCGPATL